MLADATMTAAQGSGAESIGAAKRPQAEDVRKQQNFLSLLPPEIYKIVKALAKLGIVHEREAGRSQDRKHCVAVAR